MSTTAFFPPNEKQKPGAMDMMANMSVAETRTMSTAFAAINPSPFGKIAFEDHPIGDEGVTARVFRPGKEVESVVGKEGNRPLAVLTHGGGWLTYGSGIIKDGLWGAMKSNAVRSNATKFSTDPQTIILAGSSSGGNVAAALTQRALRQDDSTGTVGQILSIPATCHPKHFPTDKYELNSYKSLENVPMLPAKRLVDFWDAYYPGSEPNVEVSPLLAEAETLTKLPPAIIQVAGADILCDEVIAYAKALEDAGVKVNLKVYAGMPHAFNSDILDFEAGHTARNDLIAAMKQLLTQRET
ncbi:MAG: hypothetical protein M1836_003599 [Candelina mexicana]|nr:MAG: hypothetical protein M1836_003599 [Candelina mexicana]